MREIWKLVWRLLLISAVAGLALGITYDKTKGPIAEQVVAAANAARVKVLPAASEFELISEAEAGMDNAYAGKSESGELVGYTAQITTRGYGGAIEITVGMGLDGRLTGINVGGAGFSETAGLGDKARQPEFMDQFAGKQPPLKLNEDVEAITAATITSKAVTDAVNAASEYLAGLLG